MKWFFVSVVLCGRSFLKTERKCLEMMCGTWIEWQMRQTESKQTNLNCLRIIHSVRLSVCAKTDSINVWWMKRQHRIEARAWARVCVRTPLHTVRTRKQVSLDRSIDPIRAVNDGSHCEYYAEIFALSLHFQHEQDTRTQTRLRLDIALIIIKLITTVPTERSMFTQCSVHDFSNNSNKKTNKMNPSMWYGYVCDRFYGYVLIC